jgi:hypothetical protein
MPHFGTPDESPSPVLGGETLERANETAKLVFIGGTGRSGTHVLAQLISRHNRYGLVPVEVRFHTDPEGFPGLLAGEVTPEQFMRRMRGFWWKGFQTRRFRGMYRFVDRERFDGALSRFESEHEADLERACRNLFYDLLWFRVGEGVKGGEENPRGEALVEQSTDNVAQAETLTRVFPEAKFIHVVRDGRDASASRVAQTRGLVRPRTRLQGIEWWEQRIRAIEHGADAIAEGHLLTMSLDELVRMQRARVALRPLFRFLGAPVTKRTRRYFSNRMTTEEANKERWREGLSEAKAQRIAALYEEALGRLEADGARVAPLLRHSLERAGDRLDPLVYVYDRRSV